MGKRTIMIVLSAILMMILVGCRTKYVAVPEYHQSTIIRTDTLNRYDSIYIHDSVYFSAVKDTIFKLRYKFVEKYKYKDRIRTDTLIKVDSIRVPYPVERKLSKWEEIKMNLGGLAIGGFIIAVCFIVIWLIRKFS